MRMRVPVRLRRARTRCDPRLRRVHIPRLLLRHAPDRDGRIHRDVAAAARKVVRRARVGRGPGPRGRRRRGHEVHPLEGHVRADCAQPEEVRARAREEVAREVRVELRECDDDV